MKAVVRWLGIVLLVAGCYWLAENGSTSGLGGENMSVESAKVGDYEEAQQVNYAAILLADTGDQDGNFDDQWRYILSNPMYLLLILIGVFINIVLLRKLIKEEL